MKRLLASIICILTYCTSMAQTEGEYVFSFLKLPASSHAAALGGSNISLIEDDATLAIENPALLQSVSHKTISAGYMNYMAGVSDYSASYVHAINSNATVGAMAQYIDYGTIKQTTKDNIIIGDFHAHDIAVGAQFAYNLGKDFVGGVTAKFLYSSLSDYSSTGIAVDLGLNYYNPNSDFSFSVVARNLGGQLSAYYDDYEKIPFDLIIGSSYRIKNAPLRISATFDDMNHLNYSLFKHLIIGADIILSPQFYIAAGYNFRRADELKVESIVDGEKSTSRHGAGLSIGVGLQLERFKLHASYAKYHISSSSLLFNVAYVL